MSVLEEEDTVVPLSPEQDSCSLDNYLTLPDHSMDARIAAARKKLGKSTVLLGHHYQRDEVIRFADYTGDSYKLSQIAAETEARYLVFCGVHFMAESADILGRPDDPPGTGQQVILPDLNAGCSMADMAEIGQVEDCWDTLLDAGLNPGEVLPLTYMNSTAAIKAFCGERGGLVCTSSNAGNAFEWAFAHAEKILFLPDQHLGRNTAYTMGIPLNEMVVFDFDFALERVAGQHFVCEIDLADRAHDEARAAYGLAQRCDHVFREHGGAHDLGQHWIERRVAFLGDQRDVGEPCALLQLASEVRAGEAAADDDDAWSLRCHVVPICRPVRRAGAMRFAALDVAGPISLHRGGA